jgi:tRNA (guanine-N7-)-methyltransferase
MNFEPEAESSALKNAEKAPDCEIKLSQWEGLCDWPIVFGNPNPLEIEIGCGRGMFIIKSARENPGMNYLGIEMSARFFRMLKERVQKSAAQKNVRIIQGEAGFILKKFVPENSVAAVHIYFPDPWPKKRHWKRRLINSVFVESVRCALVPGGQLCMATDFQDYFDEMLLAAGACSGLEQIARQECAPHETEPEKAATSYERKYLIQGRVIYKATYRKNS